MLNSSTTVMCVCVCEQTRCQDILSHQTMMDSISDKGTALASAQVQNRIRQLNTKYNSLCSKAQVGKHQ